MTTTSSHAKANGATGNGEATAEKLFGNFPMPPLDLGAALANQRKTMAALAQINQLALNGAQEMQKHQVELVKQTVDGFAAMVTDLIQPNGLSRDWIEKHTETSKNALAKTLASAREMTEVLTRTQSAAFGIWSQRVSEGFSAQK
jgi:phasin family protein